MKRLVWTPSEVVDVDGPRAMLRAYLEQRSHIGDLKAQIAEREASRGSVVTTSGLPHGHR